MIHPCLNKLNNSYLCHRRGTYIQVVESKIQSIEWLFLSSKGHKRLFVGFIENNKKFQWLIP